MSATYNWRYKAGTIFPIPNANQQIEDADIMQKSKITIAASADGVKPSNGAYVALFGNDSTGNGSRLYPFRTITKGIQNADYFVIVGSGTYRESISVGNYITLIGDGDVVYDGIGTSGFNLNGQVYGFKFRNMKFPGANLRYQDCTLTACDLSDASNYNNCVLEKITSPIPIRAAGNVDKNSNNTYIDCYNIILRDNIGDSSKYQKWNHIFVNCNLWFPQQSYLSYSLFYNCNVRFNATQGTPPTGPYTTLPAGYIAITTLANLKAAHLAGYPGASASNFEGCAVADPLFNNYPAGDYTLSFGSPAKNLSYFGTYVGNKSIAQGLKISAVEADGDFDFASAINCTISDDSLTLTDTSEDAVIETKVIENILGRQLRSIPIIGFNADRNGQYIDSIADLAIVTKAAGSTLSIPASYIVETGAIIYNAVVYTPGQRFTTLAGQTTFTTVASGVVREILEAPQRHTIEMKLGDVQPFTTEAYNHFEPGIPPTTNNVGDARTGAILRGNGDPAYVRGSGVEFPVNSKYIKIRFTIRANNLRP